jgi:hypothetical protein
MICGSCAATNAADALACVQCGTALRPVGRAVAPSAPATVADFHDLRSLSKPLFGLLGGLGVVIVVAIVSDIWQIQLIGDIRDGAFATQADLLAAADTNDRRQRWIGIAYLAVFAVTVAIFGMWIHRAANNARSFGATGFKITPGWAVGWYFVPIAQLWKPYQAMSEIWRASRNPRGWQNDGAGEFLGWWWAIWIVSTVLGKIAYRLTVDAVEVDEIARATHVMLASEAVDIITIVLAILLVKRLSDYQLQRRLLPADAADTIFR